jgi:GntR family transcriptional regulator, transcriptional repressor for pyruvate dehydrogenase complex
MLEPVKKIRLYESIVKQIQKLILSGELQPGDRLPPERMLAEQLNVSRTAIREALRSLEMMGFLESKVGVGGGTYVKKITINNILSPFSQILLQNDDFIVELLEVRLFLEIEVARLAAIRRDEEDLKKIHEAIEEMESAIRRGETGLLGDNAFHKALAVATSNTVLQQLLLLCGNLLELEREEHLSSSKTESKKALIQHKKLAHAIEQGDDKRAQTIMRDHIHDISKTIKSNRANRAQQLAGGPDEETE